MRRRFVMSACLCCLALVLSSPSSRADSSLATAVNSSVQPPVRLDPTVDLLWWAIGDGVGVSTAEGWVLAGSISDPTRTALYDVDSRESRESERNVSRAQVTELALGPISPNPTPGLARIMWSLPIQSNVRLVVYDVQGREVAVLADGVYQPGRYTTAWQAKSRGSGAAGIYFVRLRTPQRVLVKRVVVTS